jgi:hypothetical protein
MAIFGKGDDYVDYTLLKKKGILKLPEEKKLPIKSEGGFIDFTAFNTPETANANNLAQETATPNFDFLNNMAAAGASTPSSDNNVSPLANFDAIQPASSTSLLSQDDKELNALKIKIDDMDYKLDRFIERIDKLEEKLNKANP